VGTVSLPCPPAACPTPVVYTSDAEVCERWVAEHAPSSPPVVGFDIEWRPTFRAGAPCRRTALLQLAAGSSVLCCQLSHMPRVPHALQTLLANPEVVKAGVGILDDCVKLQADWGCEVRGRVDVGEVWKVSRGMARLGNGGGLKALCEVLLGVSLAKPKSVSMSNWEQAPLTERQLQYAALDAWAGRAIYCQLATPPEGGQLRSRGAGVRALRAARRDGSPAEEKVADARDRAVRKRAKLRANRDRVVRAQASATGKAAAAAAAAPAAAPEAQPRGKRRKRRAPNTNRDHHGAVERGGGGGGGARRSEGARKRRRHQQRPAAAVTITVCNA
jgi:hypothetical protein